MENSLELPRNFQELFCFVLLQYLSVAHLYLVLSSMLMWKTQSCCSTTGEDLMKWQTQIYLRAGNIIWIFFKLLVVKNNPIWIHIHVEILMLCTALVFSESLSHWFVVFLSNPSDVRLNTGHPFVDASCTTGTHCSWGCECADRGKGYIRHYMLGVK